MGIRKGSWIIILKKFFLPVQRSFVGVFFADKYISKNILFTQKKEILKRAYDMTRLHIA